LRGTGSHLDQQSSLATKPRPEDTGPAIREELVKFDVPEKIDAALFKTMFMECLALFGCIALAGTLAIAFRCFEGKW